MVPNAVDPIGVALRGHGLTCGHPLQERVRKSERERESERESVGAKVRVSESV